MTSVLVVDNYDSFTYNLVQFLGELGADSRSCATTGRRRRALERRPARVVVSPGPCTPNEAGITWRPCAASRRPACPCSGCASATSRSRQAFGGNVVLRDADARQDDRRSSTTGGRSSRAWTQAHGGRYHSLIVDPEAAAGLRGLRPRRGRGHGHPPSRPARRGRAVPSRVGAHRRRPAPAGATSSPQGPDVLTARRSTACHRRATSVRRGDAVLRDHGGQRPPKPRSPASSSPAHEGRDGRGARRPRRGDARVLATPFAPIARTSSTPRGPAAGARPSTSRPPRR